MTSRDRNETTVRAAVAETLTRSGIEDAAFEARLILEEYGETSAAVAAAERRAAREPLQYIFGHWGFYGEDYLVSPHCLIPRPDTELLVEHLIRTLPAGAHFADLCTGSGCIAVSILAHRPDCTATAVDLFPETVALARENARRNGVDGRLSVLCADVLAGPWAETFDMIVSNPPYIPARDIASLSAEVHAEPAAALDGGEDGLVFYRAILEKYAPVLRDGGSFVFEIGYDQRADIEALAASQGLLCTVTKDYGGNDRMAVIKRAKNGYTE